MSPDGGGCDGGHALAGAKFEGHLAASVNSVGPAGLAVKPLTRRLLTRSGDDGHAKAGAKTWGDLVLVRTQ